MVLLFFFSSSSSSLSLCLARTHSNAVICLPFRAPLFASLSGASSSSFALPLSRFRTRRAAVTLYFHQQYYDCVTSGRDSCSFHSLSSFACNCVHTHPTPPKKRCAVIRHTPTHTHTRKYTHGWAQELLHSCGGGKTIRKVARGGPCSIIHRLRKCSSRTHTTHTHTQPTPVSVDRIRATHARHCFAGFWVRSWLPHTDR